ncbi:8-oxoguanine DNA glycosylase OGG fold protein [Streptomyces acidicola]|uniref:8-oxoguanine DNA glycosylase OGG fold protein n=1 Tax=Streptomyces acidicola TaxID=2596892 RepID=UPI00382BA16C
MAPTDLSRLQLPRACREALAKPRSERINGHTIPIATTWWNAEIAAAHLPGAPVASPDITQLSRGDLFKDAANLDADSDEELLRFLWRVLAWGSGMKLRLNRKRMRAVADNPSSAVQALRQALKAAREDPAQAYEALRPRDHNAIAYLGPAFSTKVLYFAGNGAVDHPCAILDSQVAATLRDACKWDSLGENEWPTSTYVRYCALLDRWAREESRWLGRYIGIDEIERWLFRP